MFQSSFIAMLLLLGATVAHSAELAIGEVAPEVNDLRGTDGKLYGTSDWKAAKVVVLVFTCNHCPVARSYEPRFVDFVKHYQDKGVVFVALNADPAEDLAAMKSHAQTAGYNFPYADDADSAAVKAFGAKVTPHMFVLDAERKLAYTGAFDDNADDRKVTKHYVQDAVDALLAGKAPAISQTKPVGCGIQRKRSN